MAVSQTTAGAVIISDARRAAATRPVTVQVQVDDRLLLTVREAAHRLGISGSLLYELLASGEIGSIHVGRLRRVPATSLVDYVDQLQRAARETPRP